MKIFLHDFGGYPFSVQLAESLTSKGYDVIYSYSSSYVGSRDLEKCQASDVIPINFAMKLHKYHLVKRLIFEIRYGIHLRRLLKKTKVDVLLLSTTPLLVTLFIFLFPKSFKVIIWHQDIYSQGMQSHLKTKFGPFSNILSLVFRKIEIFTLKVSDRIVYISRDFINFYHSNFILTPAVYIPNWSPLVEIEPFQREYVDLDETPQPITIVYAGTVGKKHDLDALKNFLCALEATKLTGIRFHVVTQNIEALNNFANPYPNISLNVSEPLELEDLRELFRTADFGLVYLTKDASYYSLPSKIYTYAVNRVPIIGLVDPLSQSAQMIIESGGIVGSPDKSGAEYLARRLAKIKHLDVSIMKKNARIFAEVNCNIEIKTGEFESVILSIFES